MINDLLDIAARDARVGVEKGDGGPFGAVIADAHGNIIARGHNMVLSSNDPTCHAEVVTIRDACRKLKRHDLKGYTLYSSCEPCPMCAAAIIWAGLDRVYFGAGREDAEACGFKDKAIYDYFQGKNKLLDSKKIDNKECVKVLDNYKGEMY